MAVAKLTFGDFAQFVNDEVKKFEYASKEIRRCHKQWKAGYKKLEKKCNDVPGLIKYYLKKLGTHSQADNLQGPDEDDCLNPPETSESSVASRTKSKRLAPQKCVASTKNSNVERAGSSQGSSKSMDLSNSSGEKVKREKLSSVTLISVNSDAESNPSNKSRITRSSGKIDSRVPSPPAPQPPPSSPKQPAMKSLKRRPSRRSGESPPFQSFIPRKKGKWTPGGTAARGTPPPPPPPGQQTPANKKIVIPSAVSTGRLGAVNKNCIAKIILTPDTTPAKPALRSASFSSKSTHISTFSKFQKYQTAIRDKQTEKSNRKAIESKEIKTRNKGHDVAVVKTSSIKKATPLRACRKIEAASHFKVKKPVSVTPVKMVHNVEKCVRASVKSNRSPRPDLGRKIDFERENTRYNVTVCCYTRVEEKRFPSVFQSDKNRVIARFENIDNEQPSQVVDCVGKMVQSNDRTNSSVSSLSPSPEPTRMRIKFVQDWAKHDSDKFLTASLAQGNPIALDKARKYFQRPSSTMDVEKVFASSARLRPRTSSAIWNDTLASKSILDYGGE